MKNMKIKSKLVIGFLYVISLSIIIGIVGIFGMYRINTADDELYTGNYLPTVMAGDISQLIVQQRVVIRNFVIYDVNIDSSIFKTAESNLESVKKDLSALISEYDATITESDDRATFDEFVRAYNNEWLPMIDSIYSLGRANKVAEAKEQLTAASEIADKINEISSRLQDINMEDGSDKVNSNSKLFSSTTTLSIVLLAFCIIVSMCLAFYIAKLIGAPVNKMVEAANSISVGNMEVDVAYESKDELGDMARAFDKMVHGISDQVKIVQTLAEGDLTCTAKPRCERDVMGVSLEKLINNLNNMFGEISNATGQVSDGSRQIADGAQSLAQGSTQQAAAVEQLSSSISEISLKTQENADKAVRAADLSGQIRQNAQKGSEQMDQMMQAVKEINDAGNSINKVIKVIDDIAFQTNILALNAAVEAARAGQHGKGFAVVAEEVRNLAAKSAEAAKDTGSLIANSIEKAQLGAKIAGDTAASLNEIVNGINESTEIVNDIARSSEEQSAGIKQINTGIDQVAQVVQQNSATAEESAAASEQMSSQSNLLEELVSQFKLKNDSKTRRSQPSFSAPSEPISMGRPATLAMPPKSSVNNTNFGKY